MVDLDKYRLAKLDIDRDQFPCRENGKFCFTPGLDKILGKTKYKSVRQLTSDIETLKKKRRDLLQEILALNSILEKYKLKKSNKNKSFHNDLQQVEQELELKKVELENHKKDMDIRGVGLHADEFDQEVEEEKGAKRGKRNWSRTLGIIALYIMIEAYLYITQYDTLRDDMDVFGIFGRVISMGFLMFFYHSVAHMARKDRKVIYSITMGFYLLMIMIMMFVPAILYNLFPEAPQPLDASSWSLNETTSPSKSETNTSIPWWVELYRDLDWAPGGLGILVYLFVLYVVYNPNSKKPEKDSKVGTKNDEKEITNSEDDSAYIWFINKWKQLRREVHNLIKEKKSIKAQMQQHQPFAKDFIELRDKLEILKKQVNNIDQVIDSKKIGLQNLLSDLEAEINEYRADYMNILSKDKKLPPPKLEWPSNKDISNHFKVLYP